MEILARENDGTFQTNNNLFVNTWFVREQEIRRAQIEKDKLIWEINQEQSKNQLEIIQQQTEALSEISTRLAETICKNKFK